MLPAASASPASIPSVGFVDRLAAYGDCPALLADGRTVGYAELAGRVRTLAARLGDTRRLVLVAGRNDVNTVVAYLACLAGHHPVLLAPGDNATARVGLAAAYRPDVVLDGGRFREERPGTAHALHPELALLLSTSGSTGSPKLVRLSGRNLQANAEAIATYLSVRSTDVAMTTLPLHYCYGLSVLNSHLHAGAAMLLTDLSVVDASFWEAFRAAGATSIAGVPYTFDLLDRVGFADFDLPSLRYLTQAGGRMPAAQVQRYAALGQRRGFDLFVMYGQTEATARMAYLPPDLALRHPTAIGVPIPGGSVRLDPAEPGGGALVEDVGELVYTGENVMLGYAERPADLAVGRVVTELRTGDLARYDDAGLLEVVGRRSRFAKVYGLRIDLDRAERTLAAVGAPAHCAEGEGTVVVAVTGSGHARRVEQVAAERWGLPRAGVRVLEVPEVPRLATGKPDYAAIARLTGTGPVVDTVAGTDPGRSRCICARAGCACAGGTPRPDRPVEVAELCALYADLLGRAPDSVTAAESFVDLGGDSLSYVELSVRLEGLLGQLPAQWHSLSIATLAAHRPADAGRGRGRYAALRARSVESSVVLRALAIVAIVGTHANAYTLVGGAHLLLAVCGFNVARFQLATSATAASRVRALLVGAARVAVPAMLWVGAVTLLVGTYPWRSVLLMNGLLGLPGWSEPAWHYWFLEALVGLLALTAALMAVPGVARLDRRWPFGFPLAVVFLGLLTRYELVELRGGDDIHRAHVVLWLFALGWAVARARTPLQRCLLTGLALLTVPGFFGDPAREALVVLGLLVLAWVPRLRIPAVLVRPVTVLAAASLYIYLTHWQVYPHLEDTYPFLALLSSLAVGVGAAATVDRLLDAIRRVSGSAPLSRIRRSPQRWTRRRPCAAQPAPTPQAAHRDRRGFGNLMLRWIRAKHVHRHDGPRGTGIRHAEEARRMQFGEF